MGVGATQKQVATLHLLDRDPFDRSWVGARARRPECITHGALTIIIGPSEPLRTRPPRASTPMNIQPRWEVRVSKPCCDADPADPGGLCTACSDAIHDAALLYCEGCTDEFDEL